MADVLDTKLRRDLVANKGTLAAVVAIMALGAGSLVGIVGTYNNLLGARDRFYRQCRMADFWVYVRKAPSDALEDVRKVPGVVRAGARIARQVVVDLPGVAEPINSLALSLPPRDSHPINDIVLRSGSWFSSDEADEVIVSEKFAKARGLRPGMAVSLLAGGAKRTFRICGTAIAAEFIYLAPPGALADMPGQYGVFFLPERVAGRSFGMEGAFNQVVGLLDASSTEAPGVVLAGVERVLAEHGVIAAIPRALQFSNLTLGSDLAGLQAMAVMFPAIFFGVAALVLNVLMMRLAGQQRTIIGTLKALGYPDSTIFRHSVKFALVAGLAGGVFGAILGGWIAEGFTASYENFYVFPSVPLGFHGGLKLAGIVMAAGVAALGSIRGVRKVVGLSPAEAMRPPAPASCGPVFLERAGWLWRRLDFQWQMVLRAALRNRGRTAAAVTSSALGSAMVVLAFGSYDSMNEMIRQQFTNSLRADYRLQLTDPQSEAALLEARTLPGISSAEPVLELTGTFTGPSGSKRSVLTGLESGGLFTRICGPDGAAHRLPAHGVIMSTWLANQIGVKAGDEITFVPVRGVRRHFRLPVAGLVGSLFGMPVYADRAYLAAVLGTGDTLTRVDLRGADGGPLQDRLFHAVKELPTVESLGRIRQDKAAITTQIHAALGSMAVAMILFAAVIYFGAILNGALIGLAERKREIATFRVLGYTPGETGVVFLRESLLAAVPGALLGLPVGLWLVVGMCAQYANDSFRVPVSVAPASYAWTLLLSVAFTLGAHAIVHFNIVKLHWQEALSMKE